MRGEECQIVSDRAFDPFGFHIGEFMLAGGQGRFFPGDRRSVRRGSKQLLRDCLAPVREQRPAFIRIVCGMVIAFGQAVPLSARNRALHFQPRSPVLPDRFSFPPSAASHASSERVPYLVSASSWASMTSLWATSAARCAAISAKAGSGAGEAAIGLAPVAAKAAVATAAVASTSASYRRVCGWRAKHAI